MLTQLTWSGDRLFLHVTNKVGTSHIYSNMYFSGFSANKVGKYGFCEQVNTANMKDYFFHFNTKVGSYCCHGIVCFRSISFFFLKSQTRLGVTDIV